MAVSASEFSNNDLNNITKFELTYKFYNLQFFHAHEELEVLLQSEFPYDEPKVMEARLMAIRLASRLHVKYVQLTNKLIICYKNLANPQKRRHLKKLCDGCIGRILELKRSLAEWEVSDFHYVDQTVIGLKLYPQDLDVNIPEYFIDGITEIEKQRKNMVEGYLAAKRERDNQKNAVTKEQKMVRLAMVYIRMIQSHERARQAREYFNEVQKNYLRKEMNKRMELRKTMVLKRPRMDSAVIIQRAWRKYHFRKMLEFDYLAEMKFLSMVSSNCLGNSVIESIEKDRKAVIRRNEEEYLMKKEEIEQNILMYKAPGMKEQLEELIRNYFHKYKDVNGVFPDFPAEEDGGSDAMLAIPPEGFPEPIEATDSKSKGKKSSKSSKSSKTEKTDKSSKKSDTEDDEPEVYTLEPSKYIPTIIQTLEVYHKTWPDKKLTYLDKFDLGILTDAVEKDISLKVRLQVDEKMRIELQRLTDALQRDSKKKKKKGKKKKGKKKKGKVEKDLTPDRSLESLIEELVDQNIIREYPKRELKEFVGGYNLSGSVFQLSKYKEDEPVPCLADIRRIINELCILPMGSNEIHNGGAYVKSVLLAGPQGSGKAHLVHSICTEIGATLIDLSSENIEGKYPGKEGQEMLMHLVSKVGRLLQPTIIFIKDAEKYFWKKKPPNCPLSEPGRLKKDLLKFLKKVKNPDRLLVCGTSSSPFDADIKGLKKSFVKTICVYKPDYDCRVHLWREFICKSKVVSNERFQFSVLGGISDGFTASHIQSTVSEVLTNRRLHFLKKIPLCASDFINSLAIHVPVYEEEHQEYRKWMQKLPMGKKRVAFYEQGDEEEVEEEEEVVEDDY